MNKGMWRKYAYLKDKASLERQKEIDIMRKELEEIRILLKTLKKKVTRIGLESP